jgi:hypothetical protein
MIDLKVLIVTVTPSYKEIKEETKKAVENLERESHIVDWLILTEQLEDAGDQWKVGPTIWHNLNKARRYAVTEGYDYFLSLEWDIVPPPHTLLTLISNHADVTIGLYPERPLKVGFDLGGKLLVCNSGNCIPEAEDKVKLGLPFQIKHGCGGLGCVLVHRKVLETTQFRWEWHGDLYEKQFKVVLDPRVLCSHIDRDGSIIRALI